MFSELVLIAGVVAQSGADCNALEALELPTCQMGIFELNAYSAPRGEVIWSSNSKLPGEMLPATSDAFTNSTVDGWSDVGGTTFHDDDANPPRFFSPGKARYRGMDYNIAELADPEYPQFTSQQYIGNNYPGNANWDGRPFRADPQDFRYGMKGYEGSGASLEFNVEVGEAGLTYEQNQNSVYDALQQADEDGILRGANESQVAAAVVSAIGMASNLGTLRGANQAQVQSAVAAALEGSWNLLDHLTQTEVNNAVISALTWVNAVEAGLGRNPTAAESAAAIASSLSTTALGLKPETISSLATANAQALDSKFTTQTNALLTGIGELPTLEELEGMHERVQGLYGDDIEAQTAALLEGIGELPTLDEMELVHEEMSTFTAQQTADFIDEYFGTRQLSAPEIAEAIGSEIDAIEGLKPPTADEIAAANAGEMGVNMDAASTAAAVAQGIGEWAAAMGETGAALQAEHNRQAMGENITQAEVETALASVVDEQAVATANEILSAMGPNPTAQEIAAANLAAMGQNLTAAEFTQGLNDLADSLGSNPSAEDIAGAIQQALGRNLTQAEVTDAVRDGTGDALEGFFGSEGAGSVGDADGPDETPAERLEGFWDTFLEDERLTEIGDRLTGLSEVVTGALTGTPQQDIYFDFALPMPGGGDFSRRIYLVPSTDTPWGQAMDYARIMVRTALMFWLTIRFVKRLALVFERNG